MCLPQVFMQHNTVTNRQYAVHSIHAINKLVEYNLITEVGRLDAIGRPILFGTTEDFLRCFGVTSMEDLPLISQEKIEDFKQEAMEEVNIKVDV